MAKLIPSNSKREDCVQTPLNYIKAITEHFKPKGRILEPCRGKGIWYKFLKGYIQKGHTLEWCEILEGKDFFEYNGEVDWIITNPPYSKMRKFMQKSMDISNNIVFLTSINHLWLKARLRDVFEKGFGIKEIIIFDTPKSFPQSGFQFGCFHLCKNYKGDIKFNILNINTNQTKLIGGNGIPPTNKLVGILPKRL